MTADQLLGQIERQRPEPAYLFLGAEPFRLDQCRKALIARVLPPEEREQGLVRHDLTETPLSAILDDARSLSLFAPRRIIWASNAEAALPRAKSGLNDDAAGMLLADYLNNPTPEVVLVFEASRYELDGEDKAKAERIRKFYSRIPAVGELPRYSVREAQRLAHDLVRKNGLRIDQSDVDLLVEALGSDALRISVEMEKLSLYAGTDRRIQARDLAVLVPDSSASTVFVLVDALGRGDKLRALDLLHSLVRQGEYLPLALSFLAGLFRLALVAKDRRFRGPQQVQQQFSKPGRPLWRSRAEQVFQASSLFSKKQLETLLKRIYAADRALRDARPDDRIVMEEFILRFAE